MTEVIKRENMIMKMNGRDVTIITIPSGLFRKRETLKACKPHLIRERISLTLRDLRKAVMWSIHAKITVKGILHAVRY